MTDATAILSQCGLLYDKFKIIKKHTRVVVFCNNNYIFVYIYIYIFIFIVCFCL